MKSDSSSPAGDNREDATQVVKLLALTLTDKEGQGADEEQEYDTKICTSRYTSSHHLGRRTSPVPALALSNASVSTTASSNESCSTRSTSYYAAASSASSSFSSSNNNNDDVLSMNSAAASMKRSFAILNSLDLSVKRKRSDPHEFFGGCSAGMYAKEWSQEEKDSLIAFAHKYIIRGDVGGDTTSSSTSPEKQHDDCAKKRRTI